MAEKELSDVERVMRINKHALDSKGQLKSFTEQYGEYAFVRDSLLAEGKDIGKSPEVQDSAPFVLALNGSRFDVPEMENKPLIITNRTLRHIRSKHIAASFEASRDGELAALAGYLDSLADKMARNVLVFQDDKVPSHLVFVLQEQSRNKNTITTIVEIDNNSKGVEVDAVVSNHGRRNLLEKVSKAIDLDRNVYVNERTGAWLSALVREPAEEAPGAPIPDVARPGETGLPAERLAAIRRLSEEYCRKFPDTEASRELRRGVLHDSLHVSSKSSWLYLSNRYGEPDKGFDPRAWDAAEAGALTKEFVPWYVCEAFERFQGVDCDNNQAGMLDDDPLASYIAFHQGKYGIVHEIGIERGERVVEAGCLGGWAAAQATFEELAKGFAREHPTLSCALLDEAPASRDPNPPERLDLGIFVPWDADAYDCADIAQDLRELHAKIAEKSYEVDPPNLIELEGSRPEGHQILTDSSGEEPTYLTGPDMHLAEVIDGRLEDLPDEAQRAWDRHSNGFGPTNYLYEISTWDEHKGAQTTYGIMSEIYMTDDPETGLSHIDRFDEFEAPTALAHKALDEAARRFAWEHPDVTVLSGPIDYQWPAELDWPEVPDEIARGFEVFTPISVPDERYEEIFWDQDKCFGTIEARCREMEAERAPQGVNDIGIGSTEPQVEGDDWR